MFLESDNFIIDKLQIKDKDNLGNMVRSSYGER